MTQPATRDLDVIIAACGVVEKELSFHAFRLEEYARPTREGEAQHHEELAADYKKAARMVGVLRRYQEGRKTREAATGTAIDGRGTAAPHVDG